MTKQFLTSEMTGWYREDRRRGSAPAREDFIHFLKFNRSKRVNGWFQSLTMKKPQPFFSQNELKMLRIADISPFTAELRAQPEILDVEFRGGIHRYTPDLWIRFVNGATVLIEVKPEEFAFEDTMLEFFKAAARAARAKGIAFKVITDRYLEQEPRQRNVNELQAMRSVRPDPAFAFQVDFELGITGASTIARLSKLHRDRQYGREMLLSLVLRKHLQINLMEPILQDSRIWLPAPMTKFQGF